MTGSFRNDEGAVIVGALIQAVQENRQYLSDIDGAIGDGDHGVNMAKGFGLAREELQGSPGNLGHGLGVVGKTLMTKIGGAMGPLYGSLFRAMSRTIQDREVIDAATVGEMLAAARQSVSDLSQAKVGDKSLVDALFPAVDAYRAALDQDSGFADALEAMTAAARAGRDSTRDLVSRIGRSSRLGDRSRGVLDAGAVSCCLILETVAGSILELIQGEDNT